MSHTLINKARRYYKVGHQCPLLFPLRHHRQRVKESNVAKSAQDFRSSWCDNDNSYADIVAFTMKSAKLISHGH